ncbi:hypothetical protein [Sinorhizobium medicae]|uniref:hypothetical protein n=1 Tax=Sinorhizobium medicae TaxID=110321 RepID=UPI000FD6F77F|nr:hypothetical protein [Sinorhizobium medicae]MDX0610876.1 hypothetical protein [Sinorhizobium medicae]MDX0623211.1 hypothetical protein [Sinorhizobium medicae]MDX0641957.1 hypothetical protein [Sinorhizobium medicae]MDX0666405.1 hypothetical protein [Sinorhizobium medicae]MDX0679612.1 hypothetical protein [Sinorhizobium medicae]
MNEVAPIVFLGNLPSLVKKAADQLASATTAAEVLAARDMASVAYDAAKKAGRLAKAKQARDEVIVRTAHAQADALEIEAEAKRLFADEYDAAQERGEIRKNGERSFSDSEKVGLSDFPDLSAKAIHESRLIRNAEKADPGIVRRTLDERLANGEEPTRAALKRAIQPETKREPIVADDALWLWGRLRDFERQGYFSKDPSTLLNGMTDPMRADVRRLLPRVLLFLERMEKQK